MESDSEVLRARINLETARIPWKNLQLFFASGNAVSVAAELDLVEVALEFSQDNKAAVQRLMNEGSVSLVADHQARHWYAQDSSVWAVVVKPWVLVQED